jgi:hypothetical protein
MKRSRVLFTPSRLCLLLLCLGPISAFPALAGPGSLIPPKAKDTHYTKVGFFDMHVCNWPSEGLFFMTLFSTTHFKAIDKVEVFTPDGGLLGELDKSRFKLVKKKGKPEKRVFIKNLQIPANKQEGWYTAHITMKDGRKYLARDYVIIKPMPKVSGHIPTHQATIPIPKVLKWQAVGGAKYYKVYIKDLWDDGKIIHVSKLLDKPQLTLPRGLLKADGWYAWKVHARDVNEHQLLGDFNHGSLSPYLEFTTQP